MSPDAVIIGAGIIGAAIADTLSAAGLRVLVLDESIPGRGATSAGMGHVVLLDGSPAQLALTALSRRLLDELAPELPPSCEVDRCGTLWIAEDEAQLELARAKVESASAAGIEAALIDARELAGMEPMLRAGLAGAAFVPGDSILSPPALRDALLERAQGRGARVLEARALEIAPHTVITDAARIDAQFVVVAAGALTPRLLPALPIVPRKGYLALAAAGPVRIRHQLVELGYMHSAHVSAGSSVAFNVQPRANGQLMIGSSRELVGFDDSIDENIVSRMMSRATAFMPSIAGMDVLRTWCGFRPATPDNLPLIGAWGALPGVWIAAGHEGLGITTALGTARILADQVLGNQSDIDVLPFAPARTVRHPLTGTEP